MKTAKTFNRYFVFMLILLSTIGVILKAINPQTLDIFCIGTILITWGLIITRYLFCSYKISFLLKKNISLSRKYTYKFNSISILKRYAINSLDIRNNPNSEIREYVFEISKLNKYGLYAIITILILLLLNFI